MDRLLAIVLLSLSGDGMSRAPITSPPIITRGTLQTVLGLAEQRYGQLLQTPFQAAAHTMDPTSVGAAASAPGDAGVMYLARLKNLVADMRPAIMMTAHLDGGPGGWRVGMAIYEVFRTTSGLRLKLLPGGFGWNDSGYGPDGANRATYVPVPNCPTLLRDHDYAVGVVHSVGTTTFGSITPPGLFAMATGLVTPIVETSGFPRELSGVEENGNTGMVSSVVWIGVSPFNPAWSNFQPALDGQPGSSGVDFY